MHDETYLIKSTTLEDIADAIREKTGSQDTIVVSNFASEIENIPSGGGGLDWSAIGYNTRPSTITNAYNNAVDILNELDLTRQNASTLYSGRKDIILFPKCTFTRCYNFEKTFRQCISLLECDITSQTSNGASIIQMFYQCFALQKVKLSMKIINCGNSFYSCNSLKEIDLTSSDFSNCSEITGMFQNCGSLETINGSITTTRRMSANSTFYGCQKLVTAPTINGTFSAMSQMFQNCGALVNLPIYDTSQTSGMYNAFSGCTSLSNESLNNILKMCIDTTGWYSGNKTLKQIGLTSTQATTCQGLSNYQAFLDAGWTTGY